MQKGSLHSKPEGFLWLRAWPSDRFRAAAEEAAKGGPQEYAALCAAPSRQRTRGVLVEGAEQADLVEQEARGLDEVRAPTDFVC